MRSLVCGLLQQAVPAGSLEIAKEMGQGKASPSDKQKEVSSGDWFIGISVVLMNVFIDKGCHK